MNKAGVIVLTVVVILVLMATGAVGFAYSGIVSVAATHPHLPAVEWFLETAQENSIDRHAGTVEVVPPLDDPDKIARGLEHYHEMCVICHGAPGLERGEIGKGLSPTPPELTQEIHPPRGDFWVIKHGIRMTGMPAFGETHTDDEIWGIVAFLEELPHVSPAEYRKRVEAAGMTMPGARHDSSAPAESSSGHSHESGAGHEH